MSSQNTNTIETLFSNEAINIAPTNVKRLVICVAGFTGGRDLQREEWGNDGPFMEDVVGLSFFNPKDKKTQVVKAKDGVLLTYYSDEAEQFVQEYLEENPDALTTADGVAEFIEALSEVTGDLYDSDVAFASNLVGAPDTIVNGTVFGAAKKKESLTAVYVEPGFEFNGSTADEDGAYLRRLADGTIDMVQANEFWDAYDEI
ncbi:MAG: hypothetical protein R3Y43_06375 [Alphaproteobacteria bacterium]